MFFSKRKKIYEILQKISTQFLEIASIPLFSELPNKEIESISKRVNSLDTLRCRLIDACNIFDRINKKQKIIKKQTLFISVNLLFGECKYIQVVHPNRGG